MGTRAKHRTRSAADHKYYHSCNTQSATTLPNHMVNDRTTQERCYRPNFKGSVHPKSSTSALIHAHFPPSNTQTQPTTPLVIWKSPSDSGAKCSHCPTHHYWNPPKEQERLTATSQLLRNAKQPNSQPHRKTRRCRQCIPENRQNPSLMVDSPSKEAPEETATPFLPD